MSFSEMQEKAIDYGFSFHTANALIIVAVNTEQQYIHTPGIGIIFNKLLAKELMKRWLDGME